MELVVLSGKGGTGKTTITSSLIDLSQDVVCVDCDVDAPNLSMIYDGTNIMTEDFYGGKKAKINNDKCLKCNLCESSCKFYAIKDFTIDPLFCEGCGACVITCPNNAIEFVDDKVAEVELRKIDKGIMSCSEMEVGGDGSGKLITQLRRNALEIDDSKLIIIDGSPGVGCPVISSVTGADYVLIVTEPTMSGIADLNRVYDLCQGFKIKTFLCINKYDLNIQMTKDIEDIAFNKGITIVGKIPFDDTVPKSINELRNITYYKGCPADIEIRKMWNKIKKYIDNDF